MKRHHRPLYLFTALACAAVLQLSGCSWFFMPGPVIITDAVPTETAPSREEPSGAEIPSSAEEPSGTETEAPSSPAESTGETGSAETSESPEDSAQETGTASEDPSETAVSSAEDPSSEGPSSGMPADESSPAESTSGTTADATEESPEAPETFSIDYFRTPEILRSVASDAVLADAYHLIRACLAFRTTAKVSCAQEDAGRVIYVADTLCPLLKAFTDISEDSFADGALRWNFYVDKVEFVIRRAEFEAKVAEYFEAVSAAGPDLSETERALLLYHEYTAPASYNYEIISGAFNTRTEAEKHRIHSAYAGIVDHTGVCHDLAGGMTFLFIQGGFNAGRVSVYNKDEHSWTLIELDGRYTFCDATWDVGGSFSFFGNSAEERKVKAGGSYPLKDMNIFDLNAPSHFDIVNPGFADVQNFSRRIGNGTLLSLSVDTLVTPHCLTFTAPSDLRIIIESP